MRVAFYAPMNAPDEGPPSGDRLIARQMIAALEALGHEVVMASRLKTWSQDPAALEGLRDAAAGEVRRLLADSFDAWFTYHVYYKAPDLIGPWIARARGIPYFVAEGSHSPKRAEGPWAEHTAAVREALVTAKTIFCISPRDRPALEAAHLTTLVDLPPWVDMAAWEAPRAEPSGGPLRLMTTAMMREGDKLESYKLIAASLAKLDLDWCLTVFGDGPARETVERLFAPFGERVIFAGAVAQPILARAYAEGDLFLWPGLGEGFGMAYLEAQAAGLPCIACNGPGPGAALDDAGARLTAPTPDALAWALTDLGRNEGRRAAMGATARRLVRDRFSRERFLRILQETIREHAP